MTKIKNYKTEVIKNGGSVNFMRKRMGFLKRTTGIILTLGMSLSMAGCGNSEKRTEEYTGVSSNEEEVYEDSGIMESESTVDNSAAYQSDYIYGGEDTREYDYEEENPFYHAETTPISTFAADVDTASYSNIRSYINSGDIVPQSAVRIEEMINYFTYDYPEPENGEPFSVTMEYTRCPWNEEHGLVLIGLQTEKIDFSEAEPNNFVFLIDTSGSMLNANKLPLVQKSFTMLTENLTENDRISIVTYAGSSEVVLEGANGNEKDKITAAIACLKAGGATNGSEGIETAYALAEKYFIEGGNNRVILATDGDLNVGITDEGALVKLIKEKKESGVYLSVLGFGTDNLKDNKLESLADYGNGNYSYIDSDYEAKRVLVDEMGATLKTVAKDVKLQVEFNPETVSEYILIGYENRVMAAEDFDDDTKDGGEMGAGHRVTVLYEIIPTEDFSVALPEETLLDSDVKLAPETLLDLSIRYKEPDGEESSLLTYNLKCDAFDSASDNMRWAAAVAAFGMFLKESEYMGNTDIDLILSLAESTDYEGDSLREEFIRLVHAYEDICAYPVLYDEY